ncbi:unnamed protein product [Paramecium primaurelia]|uniref:Uncharacterized protein n=1 Tax=Paramecium primaurelia TaxID=5886 RepID=A0A8S1Q377_PARPR|nr:unnamed protein product [Paramecium primaurelia]
MCLMIYQIITSSYLPYIYSKLNKLDLSSGQFCTIAISQQLFNTFVNSKEINLSKNSVNLIVLMCFKFSFPYLFKIVSSSNEKYKQYFLTYHTIILKKIYLQ